MLLRTLILFWFFVLHSAYAYADGVFATGWGKAFDQSAEGQLIFLLFQVMGAYSTYKAIRLCYQYQNGIQTSFGNGKCVAMAVAGILLFYAHETVNFIYNSV